MEIHHYREKYRNKTDARFETLLECNKQLIKILKKWKGTPAKIVLIERKVNEVEISLQVTDPLLERILNPCVNIKLHGHHDLEA